jgi:hypothetical protein
MYKPFQTLKVLIFGGAGVAPKFAFDSELQTLNLNYIQWLESLKGPARKKGLEGSSSSPAR